MARWAVTPAGVGVGVACARQARGEGQQKTDDERSVSHGVSSVGVQTGRRAAQVEYSLSIAALEGRMRPWPTPKGRRTQGTEGRPCMRRPEVWGRRCPVRGRQAQGALVLSERVARSPPSSGSAVVRLEANRPLVVAPAGGRRSATVLQGVARAQTARKPLCAGGREPADDSLARRGGPRGTLRCCVDGGRTQMATPGGVVRRGPCRRQCCPPAAPGARAQPGRWHPRAAGQSPLAGWYWPPSGSACRLPLPALSRSLLRQGLLLAPVHPKVRALRDDPRDTPGSVGAPAHGPVLMEATMRNRRGTAGV